MVYLAGFLVRDGEPRALCVRGKFGVFHPKECKGSRWQVR